jgi:predicted ATP-grasp superfamily ATP-dependent carboligase
MKKFIIIGLTPQGLSMLRILSRAGYPVIAFTDKKKVVGYFSKYGDKRIFSSIDDLKQQIKTIQNGSLGKIGCIITSGKLLALIISEFPELYDICEVQSGPLSLVKMLSHKNEMYEFAEARGLKFAKYILLSNYKPGILEFPVILKLNYEIPIFFKVKKIENETDLSDFIKKIAKDDYNNIIIQEYIEVEKYQFISYQAYILKGKDIGNFSGFQVRRLSIGLTSFIQEITDLALIEIIKIQSSSLFNGTNYTGFVEVEYLFDPESNNLIFMEVNTRPCGTHSVLKYKFSNISALYDDITNPPLLISRSTKPISWINIARDVKARIENKDFTKISQFCTSKYDILDFDDLKPFLYQFFKL